MHLHVELVAYGDPADNPQWFAKLNGVEYPIDSYALEPGTGGPLLSLVFAPSSFRLGDPSTGPDAPKLRDATPEKPLATWGAPGVPDPRAAIPGWTPESLGGQVAANAQAVQS